MRALAHSLSLVGLCCIAATASLAWPDRTWAWTLQLWLAVPAILLLGVPHGALDVPVAQRLFGLDRLRGWLRFGAVYGGLMLAVAALWWAAPTAALALFLGYSALHFGEDWHDEADPLRRLLYGATILAAAFLHAPQEVAAIFQMLAPDGGALAWQLAGVAPWLAITSLSLLLQEAVRGRSGRAGLELPALIVLGLTVPPLMLFTIYFCLLHAPRHFADTAGRLHLALRPALAAAVPATLMTGAGAAAAWALIQGDAVTGLIRATFIGLAALTVPHMLLTGLLQQARHPIKPAGPRSQPISAKTGR